MIPCVQQPDRPKIGNVCKKIRNVQTCRVHLALPLNAATKTCLGCLVPVTFTASVLVSGADNHPVSLIQSPTKQSESQQILIVAHSPRWLGHSSGWLNLIMLVLTVGFSSGHPVIWHGNSDGACRVMELWITVENRAFHRGLFHTIIREHCFCARVQILFYIKIDPSNCIIQLLVGFFCKLRHVRQSVGKTSCKQYIATSVLISLITTHLAPSGGTWNPGISRRNEHWQGELEMSLQDQLLRTWRRRRRLRNLAQYSNTGQYCQF